MEESDLIDHLAAGQAALVLSSRVLALLVQRWAPTQSEAAQVLRECAQEIRKLGEAPHLQAAKKLESLAVAIEPHMGPKQ